MSDEITIQLPNIKLRGNLSIPHAAQKLVIFAHGSGSSRLSPRNQYVAKALNDECIATFLFDLLTEEEEVIDDVTREFRFNIPLLAERLIAVSNWLNDDYLSPQFHMGYFGSSTGAGAALIASSQCPIIKAVVSRGGRPDLAEEALTRVTAATLLVVGEKDPEVIELNKQAFDLLNSKKEIVIVPNATHLFEEPGTLDEVIRLAAKWFNTHLVSAS